MLRLSISSLVLVSLLLVAVDGVKTPPRLRREGDLVVLDDDRDGIQHQIIKKGLIERSDCIAFADLGSDQRNNEYTHQECKSEGGCNNGGCCRVHTSLFCDASDGLRHLPCVCNNNTRESGQYTGWTITDNNNNTKNTMSWTPPPTHSQTPEEVIEEQHRDLQVFAVRKKSKDNSKSKDKLGVPGFVSSTFEAPGTPQGYDTNVGAVVVGITITSPGGAPRPVPLPAPAPPATPLATPGQPAPGQPAPQTTPAAPGPILSAQEAPGNTPGTAVSSTVIAGTPAAGTPAAGTPGTPGNRFGENHCSGGSWYWGTDYFQSSGFVFCIQTVGGAENAGCNEKIGECCLGEFCMCGQPNGGASVKCVPPFDPSLVV
ncbi:expressed unknown protein [Seminavis robusta]|uniref:Uncharacterized protein n=1 Tax=Seminavis robusta TaxID=568900 RepID=A0A9N8HYD9_9STRA|nr:expressed unknown protein [Seminavis robusta]|eukprot:Sro2851_g338580.1 n/a (372) ;mRNA; f:5811-6926